MLQALERKQSVGVVVITAGDGFESAAAVVAGKERDKLVPEDFLKLAALRQQHSLRGMARLGVPAENLDLPRLPGWRPRPIYQHGRERPRFASVSRTRVKPTAALCAIITRRSMAAPRPTPRLPSSRTSPRSSGTASRRKSMSPTKPTPTAIIVRPAGLFAMPQRLPAIAAPSSPMSSTATLRQNLLAVASL